jgi:hypothetical protein
LSSGPAKPSRTNKIAKLLSQLVELMRQEGMGKEALHHLRQLQMRVRFDATSRPRFDEPPTVAPATWLRRERRDESPVDFIRREYNPWLGKSLTRAHLRQLDMSLYEALKHWLRENDAPPDFDLPTKKEMTDRKIAQTEELSLVFTPEQRERLRLYQAAKRRNRAAKKLATKSDPLD